MTTEDITVAILLVGIAAMIGVWIMAARSLNR